MCCEPIAFALQTPNLRGQISAFHFRHVAVSMLCPQKHQLPIVRGQLHRAGQICKPGNRRICRKL
jgi:hypothetical protein